MEICEENKHSLHDSKDITMMEHAVEKSYPINKDAN